MRFQRRLEKAGGYNRAELDWLLNVGVSIHSSHSAYDIVVDCSAYCVNHDTAPVGFGGPCCRPSTRRSWSTGERLYLMELFFRC